MTLNCFLCQSLNGDVESQNALSWKGPQGPLSSNLPAMGTSQVAQRPIQTGLERFQGRGMINFHLRMALVIGYSGKTWCLFPWNIKPVSTQGK